MDKKLTHTIRVTGIEVGGWIQTQLDCDDIEACKSEGNGECVLRSWWEEVGVELIAEDLKSPPPWKVIATWTYEDGGPELYPFREELDDQSTASH